MLTLVAFPVLTLVGVAIALLIGPRPDRPRAMLRAVSGALVGLLFTSGLGAAAMAGDLQDAWYYATAVLTVGVIPAGLIGLITGGLATLLQGKTRPTP